MSRSFQVHLLPVLFEPSEVAGGTVVVVDILRASTTITVALQNGATGVKALGTVEDAFRWRDEQGAESCLLGGERGGIKVEGFDLSNSPDDYGPSVVQGRMIGFTTTNGTGALLKCLRASRILIGAFVNLSSVAEVVLSGRDNVHIVCAGTNGAITGDDILFAGALGERLQTNGFEMAHDSTQIAVDHWRQACGESVAGRVEAALRSAQGGRNLIELGYDKDITTAAQSDLLEAVGELDGDGVIRLRSDEGSA